MFLSPRSIWLQLKNRLSCDVCSLSPVQSDGGLENVLSQPINAAIAAADIGSTVGGRFVHSKTRRRKTIV